MSKTDRLYLIRLHSIRIHGEQFLIYVICTYSQEIHREHFYVIFLGWDHDVLYVLAYGNEGSCFYVVEASVFDKILDGLPCQRLLLDFIEDND